MQHDPFSRPTPDQSTQSADRRRAGRQAADKTVRVSVDTTELMGVANNISKTGVLFFTDGELRVTVEIEEGGETKKLTGSLVRCERIKGDHRGWAVEFGRD